MNGLDKRDIDVLSYYAEQGNRELYWNYLANKQGNDGYLLSERGRTAQAGELMFVVQGDPKDPAHLRAQMPTADAVRTPVAVSLERLAEFDREQALAQQQAARQHAAPLQDTQQEAQRQGAASLRI